MTDLTASQFGYTDGDVDTNISNTSPTLGELAEQRVSRRATMRGGAAIVAATMGGSMLAACDNQSPNPDIIGDGSAPTVSAGGAVTTSSGRVVTLTGTASGGGDNLQTAWTQTGGPTVTFTGGNTITFMAPSVSTATTLTFQFAAAASGGTPAVSTTTVTVNPATLGFTAVAKNKNDVVTVPAGYTVQIGTRTGDPLAAGVPAYKNDGTDTNFAQRTGDHGDALYWFGLSGAGARDDTSSTRGLIVQNHENINQQYLHVAGPTTVAGARPESEAIKEIECHGVAITEYAEGANRVWSYNQSSSFNRRITPNTPVVFNGPARGSDLLKTPYSNAGTDGRGTVNNCANGYTPWGTAITCEENWAGYFRRSGDNAARTAKELTSLTRYGVTSATGNFGWSTVVPADPANTLFKRWDARATGADALSDWRNEPNQFGWIVEIDPYSPGSTPRKRTALGRMNHEGCWPGAFVAGRKPAWYMGDDAVNEYLYKFVSATAWTAADATASNRLSIGDKYLDNGTLYVAVFNADGTGSWKALTFGTGPLTAANATYPFADQADVLANARLAADALGATRMDRPEWTAVNPANGEVYLTLTNNSTRSAALTDAANPRSYADAPNAGSNRNWNGHIIRLRENGDNTEATAFTWDIYAFGAGSDLDPANINVSGLSADNDFSSPDGLWFGRPSNASGLVKPVLWVQTDDSAYTDVTNCMMLAAMPGRVADGGARTIVNGAVNTATRVGAAPGANLKRFLVGPLQAEITGVDTTPDGRTLFVGIQHPGENGTPAAPSSHWPDSQATGSAGATVRPRSAMVIITKDDGGVVAL